MANNEQLFEKFGKEVPAGTVLFREGDAGDTMYVIQSGRVRISRGEVVGYRPARRCREVHARILAG